MTPNFLTQFTVNVQMENADAIRAAVDQYKDRGLTVRALTYHLLVDALARKTKGSKLPDTGTRAVRSMQIGMTEELGEELESYCEANDLKPTDVYRAAFETKLTPKVIKGALQYCTPSEETVMRSYRMPVKLMDRLDAEATSSGKSKVQILIEALEAYL